VLVMKFGGSSVADARRIRRVAELVAAAAGPSEPAAPIVVSSAMGGVTDHLFAIARTALGGRAAQADALERVAALQRQHEDALAGLETASVDGERTASVDGERTASVDGERTAFVDGERTAFVDGERTAGTVGTARGRFDRYFAELRDIVIGVSLLGELSPRSLDAITSYGEKLAVELVAAALRAGGTPAEAISAEDIVVTDDVFGNAAPDMAATAEQARRLADLARAGTVPVVTGYIGASPAGATTTLGRNGSDYSAAIIGAAVGADEVWIWTDVDGVMSADPRLVPGARSLPALSYVEASELAYFGSKVIHPRTIVPAVAAGVPIRIKNTFNPAHPGTLIGADALGSGAVKGVTVIRDLALVTVEGLGMLGVPGIAARTLGAVATAGANVLMISQSSSESNIALVIARSEVAPALLALRDAFAPELRRHDVDAIGARDGMAIITVVGSGMRGTPGMAGRFFSVLGRAGINVSAIAQGSSEYSISCVIYDDGAGTGGTGGTGGADGAHAVHEALRAVHHEFIEGDGQQPSANG